MDTNFETIPQAPRYEMNGRGVIRNKSTGKILKWGKGIHDTPQMNLVSTSGKKICVTKPSLLWFLHGKIICKKRTTPVRVKKGTRSIRFDSLSQAARFLSEVTHLKPQGAWYHLSRRRAKVIHGWQVRYGY